MEDCYLLTNLEDLSNEIYKPISNTLRVKYTCMDASINFIVFGATSGSVYIFRRNPWKYLQLIPNQFGIINQIAISPNEKYIAYTGIRGNIGVYVINFTPSYVHIIRNHIVDALITCLEWKQNEEQFYIGDSKGIVYLVSLSFFMMGRHLTNISIQPILFLDAAIVQIADYDIFALISNYNKCIICNTENEEFKQIGNHPRAGYYGVCVLPLNNNNYRNHSDSSSTVTETDYNLKINNFNNIKLFCARPKARLWEANIEGKVLRTHQFKLRKQSIYSTKIIRKVNSFLNINDTINKMICCINYEYYNNANNDNVNNFSAGDDNNNNHNDKIYQLDESQILQFGKLLVCMNKFIISFNEHTFYIIDPNTSKVILWSNEYQNIDTIKVINNLIIIYTKESKVIFLKLHRFQDFVIDFLYEEKFILCASIIRENLQYFHERFLNNDISIIELIKLYNKLKELNENVYLKDLHSLFNIFINSNNFINDKNIDSDNGNSIIKNDKIIMNSKNTNRMITTATNNTITTITTTITTTTTTNNVNSNKNSVFSVFSKNFLLHKLNVFNNQQQQQQQILLKKSLPMKLPLIDTDSITTQTNKALSNQNIISNNKNINNNNNHLIKSDNENFIQNKMISNDKLSIIKVLTEEEKLIQNLYLIFRSAKISNLNLVERYANIFDQYDFNGIQSLLKQLEIIMIDNGDTKLEAQKNCYEMYFNYLNPQIIWEMNYDMHEYIINGFILINTNYNNNNNNNNNNNSKCEHCSFPLIIDKSCKFSEIGKQLIKYLWSHNQQKRCFEIANNVSYVLYIIGNLFYRQIEFNEIIPLLYTIGDTNLFEKIINDNFFTLELWIKAFDIMCLIITDNKFLCIKCNEYTIIQFNEYQNNRFYSWNYFLYVLINHGIDNKIALKLIKNYSNHISSNSVEKKVYLCLLAK